MFYFSFGKGYFIPYASTASISRYLYRSPAPYRVQIFLFLPFGLEAFLGFQSPQFNHQLTAVLILNSNSQQKQKESYLKRQKKPRLEFPYRTVLRRFHGYSKPIQYRTGLQYTDSTRQGLPIVSGMRTQYPPYPLRRLLRANTRTHCSFKSNPAELLGIDSLIK